MHVGKGYDDRVFGREGEISVQAGLLLGKNIESEFEQAFLRADDHGVVSVERGVLGFPLVLPVVDGGRAMG